MTLNQQTSIISILSGEHGRLRREVRDTDTRDLRDAITYGTRKPSYGGRWKIEHNGIIFIVDPTMRTEITAFPAPLREVPINEHDLWSYEQAKNVIKDQPELCKSHTVLVVDNSGSMYTHDIPLHRDRKVAAYCTLALEFIAEQLLHGTANDSDVVSLIEFNGDAQVVFTREPCSWVLYNKLLSRGASRNFESRQQIQRDVYQADSN